MLSLDCDGCSQRKACELRFITFKKGDKVACPDGDTHLIDCEPEWIKQTQRKK